jgi:hypothetical protein
MLRRTLAAAVAIAVSLAGVAVATIPAKDGDVHACYSKRTGEIELVDTQADRFDCPHNWRGLAFDTSPTKLVSPNGLYRVEVTNQGVTLTAPAGTVKLGVASIDVRATAELKLSAGGVTRIDGHVLVNGVPQQGD